jgi:hypothetical protein
LARLQNILSFCPTTAIAYDDTSKLHLYLPALVLSVLPLVLACFAPNFYLGTNHNIIESKQVILHDEVNEEEIKRKAEEVRRKAKEATGRR